MLIGITIRVPLYLLINLQWRRIDGMTVIVNRCVDTLCERNEIYL